MTVSESLLVGVFGMAVVFVVLVGLNLLVKLQTVLIDRLTKEKITAVPTQESNAKTEQDTAPVPDEPPAQARPTAPEAHSLTNRMPSAPSSTWGKRNFVVFLNGKTFELEVESDPPTVSAAADTPQPQQSAPQRTLSAPVQPAAPAPKRAVPATSSDCETIAAPVPGTVLDIRVSVGDTVKRGQILLLLEAMKMENEIVATRDGVIKAVLTSKGTTVALGASLIELN